MILKAVGAFVWWLIGSSVIRFGLWLLRLAILRFRKRYEHRDDRV